MPTQPGLDSRPSPVLVVDLGDDLSDAAPVAAVDSVENLLLGAFGIDLEQVDAVDPLGGEHVREPAQLAVHGLGLVQAVEHLLGSGGRNAAVAQVGANGVPVAIAVGMEPEPGGSLIVSTPFMIRVHELPLYALRDYWRFTPRGLRTPLEQAGLVVDEVGAWGNRDCIVGNLDRWSARRRWHSLRNEPDAPVQVWAFAHRPARAS